MNRLSWIIPLSVVLAGCAGGQSDEAAGLCIEAISQSVSDPNASFDRGAMRRALKTLDNGALEIRSTFTGMRANGQRTETYEQAFVCMLSTTPQLRVTRAEVMLAD